jgi:hypothetical protein
MWEDDRLRVNPNKLKVNGVSGWSYDTDILRCTVNETLNKKEHWFISRLLQNFHSNKINTELKMIKIVGEKLLGRKTGVFRVKLVPGRQGLPCDPLAHFLANTNLLILCTGII